MNIRYMGVYWTPRKEELPEDGTVCVFHKKRTKPDNIRFGYFYQREFRDKTVDFCEKKAWVKASEVDYWMPIPILPTEEGVKDV